MTKLLLTDRRIDVPLSTGEKDVSSSHSIEADSGFHPVYFELSIGLAFLEGKAAGA
jgi:hypothetical protein